MAPYDFLSHSSSSNPHSTSPSSLSSSSIPHHDAEDIAQMFSTYLSQTSTPPNRGPMVFTFTIATTVLTTLLVLLRLHSRRTLSRRLLPEDYLITLATLTLLVSTILNCIGISQGAIGRPLLTVVMTSPNPLTLVTFAIKLAYTYQLLYLLTLLLLKLSLLSFYLRLLPPTHRTALSSPFILTIYTTMAALVVYTLISVLLLVFQCSPVWGYWTPRIHEASCPSWDGPGGMKRLYGGVLVVSVGSDFWVLLMPVALVWRLRVGGWRKVGCVVVFSLGTVACVAAVVRLYLVYTRPMYKDITWDLILLMFWGQAEIAVAIICACLPALKGLVQHYLHQYRAKSVASSSSYTASSGPVSTFRHKALTRGEKTTMAQFLNRDDSDSTFGSGVVGESRSIDLEKALTGTTSSSRSSPTKHIAHQYSPPSSPRHPPPAHQVLTTTTSSSSSSSGSVKTIGTFAALTGTSPGVGKGKGRRKEGAGEFERFEEWERRFTWDGGEKGR